MSLYSCNLHGQCEADGLGIYPSLEECEANCLSMDDRQSLDLAYLVLSYDWDQARQLAPSDKKELIKRTFGVNVSIEKADELIYYLSQAEVYKLWNQQIPCINEYLEEVMDGLDLFILELSSVAILKQSHEEMRERVINTTRTILSMYGDRMSDELAIGRIGATLLGSSDIVEIVNDIGFLTTLDVKWLALLKELLAEIDGN